MLANYTDTQLLRMFPVLLPEEIDCLHFFAEKRTEIFWLDSKRQVKPTELLDLCRRIEEKLKPHEWRFYSDKLMVALRDSDIELCGLNIEARYKTPHASWQQRVIALCEVLGKEIPEV